MTIEDKKKLTRRIIDYLWKYAGEKQLLTVAKLLGVKV